MSATCLISIISSWYLSNLLSRVKVIHVKEFSVFWLSLCIRNRDISSSWLYTIRQKSKSSKSRYCLISLKSLITLIPEASKGLQVENQESEQNKSETDWAARLAIHFFSPLSQTKDYVLDNHGLKKCERCPCSCKKIIRYDDTSMGKNLLEKLRR